MPPDADPVALSSSSLPTLDAQVHPPGYDRAALRRSIVHIGVGGFHRAHLATYVDDLARQGVTDWGIVGVGVLASDARMAHVLDSQDHLYTLISRGADQTEVTVIGSLVDYLHVADDAQPLIELLAHPDTQIVSMTITEGGYPVDDASGDFVAARSEANGVFALLARGLERRRCTDGGPLTVLSCDNIMTNGQVARTATLGAAEEHSAELVRWIDANVAFPNSMVDRITPTTTARDCEWLERHAGIVDAWPVVAEPFRQWVVEDHFGGDRLPLEAIDVIVTDDIDPYELTKLRLLNAGHSCLAYLASLEGHELVHVAMADSVLRNFVTNLLHEEAKPTLPAAEGIDLDDYIESLIERFSNPGVGDQISRLCLDGTSKFPKFLLPTVRAQLEGEGCVERSALALAGWCEYLARTAEPSPDPRLERAVQFARRSLDDPAAFLGFTDVFGEDLRESGPFRSAFVRGLQALRDVGVQSAVLAAT